MAKRLRELRIVNAGVKVLTVDLEGEVFVPIARIGGQIKKIIELRET